MRQFFVKQKLNNCFCLDEKDIHHAIKVLRLKLKENIICVYENKKYLCKVINIKKNQVFCEIINPINQIEKMYKITFFLPIMKQKIWDFMVEKLTELGCDVYVPVMFSLCQQNEIIRFDRLNKIIKNACEQSNQTKFPLIEKLIDFKKMVNDLNIFDMVLLGDERCFSKLKIICSNLNLLIEKPKNIALIIGPSGGFTNQEFETLKDKAISLKLSNNILKTETAAISIINFLQFIMEINYGKRK